MKIKIITCITAVLLLTGASVWEGSGAVASGGELPGTGYYAATNSFPKNTVVDITNLENGKSIRVIVAAGLDTPGLLALVSGEAAGIIGLSSSSIGRIRMSQPSDPIAFSRFTDGQAAGIPDYDSGAVNTAVNTEESVYTPPGGTSPGHVDSSVMSEKDAAPVGEKDKAVSSVSGRTVPSYTPEPEWEEGVYRDIVDLSDTYSPPPANADEGITRETAPALVVPDEPAAAEPVESIAALEPERPAPDAAAPVPPAAHEGYDYSLTPAEERPPEPYASYDINPENIIPEIAEGESFDLESPVSYTNISDIPFESAERSNPATAPFSIPLVSNLERGSYYVQLGAYSRVELIEPEISRIDTGYPLTVYNAGSADRPLYRILLGPLNQGESGAVLQRFKSIGYKDAFVRSY
ncbi:lipoprotein [Spirochaetia bacterium]|nr:lipoprotein [Spirochaetia bacterium]